MEDGQVVGVDYMALQEQAQRQYLKLMQSHSSRAFGQPPWRTLFRPALPYADGYSAEAPLVDTPTRSDATQRA
jgi:hypothetical protein